MSLNPEQKKVFEQNASSVFDSGPANEKDFYEGAQKSADAMERLQGPMRDLGKALAALPRDQSLLASGPYAPAIAQLAGSLQQIATILGVKTLPFTPEDLKNVDTVQKIIANLSAEAAQVGGQNAAEALGLMAQRFPQLATSKGGQGALFADILVEQRKQILRNDFHRAGLDYAQKEYPDIAFKTGRPLGAMFDSTWGSAYFDRDKKALTDMFNQQVTINNKPLETPDGRKVSWLEYMYENAHKMTPAQREQVIKKFGSPGIFDYFGGVRG
jgi:hypothetical protein